MPPDPSVDSWAEKDHHHADEAADQVPAVGFEAIEQPPPISAKPANPKIKNARRNSIMAMIVYQSNRAYVEYGVRKP